MAKDLGAQTPTTSPKDGLMTLEEAPTASDEKLPIRLGSYQVLGKLGNGGMGAVFLGRHHGPGGFEKFVAIKRVHPHLADEHAFLSMFLDEARIAAAIQHPGVVQVYALHEDGGEHLLVMEYVHGVTLDALMRAEEQALPVEVALFVASKVAEALHGAHESSDGQGNALSIVHRDVTPQNIFLTFDGQVKLSDFGVSKANGRLAKTESGWLKGKAAYMSPEQLRGDPIDRRLDVFSLGVVLWEMVTGRRLFQGRSQAEVMMAIVAGQVPPAVQYNPAISRPLHQTLTRALASEPEDRYATALAFARALQGLEEGTPDGQKALAALIARRLPEEQALRGRWLNPETGHASQKAPPAESNSKAPKPVGTERQPEGRANRKPALLPLLGIALALLLVGGAWWFLAPTATSVLRVDSEPPGAVIFLDGVQTSEETPALLEGITAGWHDLRLEHAGYAAAERRVQANGERVRLSVALTPSSTNDRIDRGDPPSSEEEETGRTSEEESVSTSMMSGLPAESPATPTMDERTNPTGTGSVEAPPSMSTQRETAPSMTARRVDMRRAAPSYLNIVTIPSVTVSIRGRPYGRTPMRRREIPSGPQVLELRADDGRVHRVRIDGAPGEAVSVPRVTLPPPG